MGDPVPEPADRLERVVQAKGRIAEMFKLLQHRVRQTGQERVAAQHQHRQPVGMGQRGGCQQVRRPRPRTGRAEHEAAAQVVFGIGRSRKPHALFVLAPVKRHFGMDRIQRLAQTRHIAVSEDPETAAADPGFHTVDEDVLVHQPAHDGLSHRQPDVVCGYGHGFPPRRRELAQTWTCRD